MRKPKYKSTIPKIIEKENSKRNILSLCAFFMASYTSPGNKRRRTPFKKAVHPKRVIRSVHVPVHALWESTKSEPKAKTGIPHKKTCDGSLTTDPTIVLYSFLLIKRERPTTRKKSPNNCARKMEFAILFFIRNKEGKCLFTMSITYKKILSYRIYKIPTYPQLCAQENKNISLGE